MAGGLVHLWEEHGIQFLVLLSFSFQVFLLAFAGIRRRKASALMRLLVWLVYLLADSTAIYALGHLSLSRRPREHGLMAFWAPFLLVHLGGPDTITAYALEDSRLWLRHLLVFLVQVAGVAYVIARYTADSGGPLVLAASVLMFVVGVLKYAERIWALRCGNMSSFRSKVQFWLDYTRYATRRYSVKAPSPYNGTDLKVEDGGDEEFLLEAHYQFVVCQSIFADVLGYTKDPYYCEAPLRVGDRQIDVYKVVEMELSLMYDIFYTKAEVIHTRYGYCIRVVSLLATIASVVMFLQSNNNRDGGYSEADVAITYVLLLGALVLEIISVSRAMVSTWTCALLLRMGWKPLLKGLKFVRRHVHAARKRRMSSSIGQYNMLHLCTRNMNELGSRLALKIGIEDWWNRSHFVGTTDISKTDLPMMLLAALPNLEVMNSRGINALVSRGLLQHHGREWISWSMTKIDFDQSILIWHTATDIYLCKSTYKHEYDSMDHPLGKRARAVRVLSNYMLFLLVAKPDLVPGPIHPTMYVRTGVLQSTYHGDRVYPGVLFGDHVGVKIWPITWGMVKKLFHKDGPALDGSSRIEESEKFARAMFDTFTDSIPPRGVTNLNHSYRMYGSPLAGELLGMESNTPELIYAIFEVWLEMLCYAANHSSGDSHARQLSNGGEFITVVWLLARQIHGSQQR